jgi:kinesin family protein 6/9
VYENSTQELVTSVVQGYNGTIMCYGQTGAGKTFTMTGSSTEYKYRGIVPRAIAQVYHEIAAKFDQAITIRVSYIEIYNEMVSNKQRLTLLDVRLALLCSHPRAKRIKPLN